MIKNGNPQNFYNGNIQHIKVNKRIQNNNIKDISPPHQNNYFYNTKINRLILQEAPKNNRIQNIYQQQPVPSNKSIYIVEAGDTLWSIARKNNINVDELKTINNLTSNLISVGQELIIE